MAADYAPRSPAEQLQLELGRLRDKFAAGFPQRLQALEDSWAALLDAAWDINQARAFHRTVHGLVGTAGSLGFVAVSRSARLLERALVPLLEKSEAPDSTEVAAFEALLGPLRESPAVDLESSFSFDIGDSVAPPPTLFEPRNLIVVVQQGEPFAGELALQLGHFGFELQMFDKVDEVVATSMTRRPAAVITDLCSPDGDLLAVDVAAEVREAFGDGVPMVFVSNRSDIEARLDAVRAGCNGYFVKPVNYPEIVETLDRITRGQPEPYRILIVDDEPETAAYHAASLESAGLEVVVVTQPLEISSQLVEFQPDVILMDVYMPGCNGMELAAVIRQEEAYVGVPIVFLSRETDRMKQIAALGEGGDDFFTKPVAPEQLVGAVTARAQRGRTLRLFMERDGLTGLFSHSRIIEHLEMAVVRADRHHGRLAVAMLDIDGFKQVNDTYGHLVGDQLLKALAYLLRQRLRLSDVLGRFGGDEYLIVMPDTCGEGAHQKMDDIRRNFSAIEHDTGRGSFSVTLSCGVAEFPTALTANELIAAADAALYRAKRAGRDRVFSSGGEG